MLRGAKYERRAMPTNNGKLLPPLTLKQTRISFACIKPVDVIVTQLAAHSSTTHHRLAYELPTA